MNIENSARFIIQTLKEHGHEAYYVGGCVRDGLLGLALSDIDIATSATSLEIQSLFEKTIPVGIKFGIIVVVKDGFNFEVATFRKDKDYVDGRHPEGVERATLEEDVKRRDFTVNGLYFDPITETIYDFVDGQKDLKQKVLKAIGEPQKRFEEDHLRMIRACRYAACLGLTIEPKTRQAIITMASICHEGVSIERIVQELEKMHSKGFLKQGLEKMHELMLLFSIFPQLKLLSDLDFKLDQIGKLNLEIPLIFPLCILFGINDHTSAETFCRYLKLSNDAIKMAQAFVDLKDYRNLKNIELAKLLTLPYFDQALDAVATFEPQAETCFSFINQKQGMLEPVVLRLIQKSPIVSSEDLIALNIPKGPLFKKWLDEAMSYFADHPSLDKKAVLDHIKRLM